MKNINNTFYLLLLSLLTFKIPGIFNQELQNATFVNISAFLNSVSKPVFFLSGILIVEYLLILFCLLKHSKIIKFFVAIFFTILIFSTYPFGKISHDCHPIMFASFAMIFFDPEKTDNNKFNPLSIIQIYYLSIYFNAFIWKLRHWLEYRNAYSIRESILNQVASALAEGNGPRNSFLDLYKSNPDFFVLGFTLVILFQATSLLPVFYKKLTHYWGFMALFFHLSTGLFLGIWFTGQFISAVFFLIYVPILAQQSKEAQVHIDQVPSK